jgi:hypothetical protein
MGLCLPDIAEEAEALRNSSIISLTLTGLKEWNF